jgi:PAS domain S-box-containing protein
VTASHDDLNIEIEGRKAGEAEIRQLNADLDKRLRERTTDLEQRTRQLAAESEQRLKTQQALADQIALVAGILNAIPYPIFVKDAEARFLICNHAYEHAFGVESESLKGQTVLDLDCLPEEERIRFHDEDVAVIRDADQRSYELTIAFADEEEHPALYSVNGFRHDDGRPGGLIGLLVDITDHKRAEQELAAARQAVEQANGEKGDLTALLSETQAKLVAAIRATEEAARKATRERDHLAARLAETEEKLAESICAAEEAAARQAFAAETIVVAREELAEPTGTPEGEAVESMVPPAAESEIEPDVSEAEEEQGEPDRQASAEAEIDATPDEESAVDDLPPTESDAVIPIEPVEAGFAEPAPSPPGREQEKSAEQQTPEEPPAKPGTRKSPRARKNAAPSPQQELFTLDAPQPVASTISARGESKDPAPPPESVEEETESKRADRSVRIAPAPEPIPDEFVSLDGIDAADRLRRAGGNRKVYRNLLLKFRDSHGHVAGEIQTAVESGNQDLARRLVHTLKGASANIGADELCEVAKALEAVMKGQAQDEDEALLPRLDAELRRVVASIDELEPPAGAPSVPVSPPAPRKASEVAAPRPFDVKALRLSLWTLESLLRNADIDAQAELEALHPQVKGTAFEARFATLAREIAGERFESAVAELERIKTDLAG